MREINHRLRRSDCGERQGQAGLYRAPSDDVLLEILDGVALHRNDPRDQIADRHDTHHLLALNDRKVTNPLACDDSHAIVEGMARAHGHDRARHDVSDRRGL